MTYQTITVQTQAELDAALAFDAGARLGRMTTVTPSGCWQWTGSSDGRYGRMRFDGRLEMAHRVSLALSTGGFRALDADHLCGNTLCVNPAHLEWVTHAENNRRKTDGGCRHGHAWTPENTQINPRGHRRCRACNRDQLRRRRAKAKAQTVHVLDEVTLDGDPIGGAA